MAKVRNNIVMKGLSGSLGDQLVFKQDKAGRTIVSVKPSFDPNHTFTDAQKQVQENFRDATTYAKSAKTQEEYVDKANKTAHSAYNVAVADWFHAPEIKEIDVTAWHGTAGEIIRVQAVDDVKVTQVMVVITDGAGTVLEQGAAEPAEGAWWNYTATVTDPSASRIVVTARDLPGHIAEFNWED